MAGFIILKVEWDLSPAETDSIISIVFLGALLGTLILGPLGDKIGRKPVFSVTAVIIAVAGLGTAIVPNYEWLLIARFVVGFGVEMKENSTAGVQQGRCGGGIY